MKDNSPVAEYDKFAEIAAQKRLSWSKELVQPKPVKFEAKALPPMKAAKGKASKRARVDSLDQVVKGIAKLRREHAPFLVNHAPTMEPIREVVALEQFNWRLETTQDRANFAGILDGAGEWTHVTVPHYGPPEGRATAYYRTVFQLDASLLVQGALYARFRGVDYKAHVFVNGTYLGSHEGFFAPFEFECSAYVRAGENTLVVKVENDAIMMGNSSWEGVASKTEGDKLYAATGPGYDDPEVGWHHCPPAMGIYQPVSIESRARLHVNDLFVRPLPETSSAEACLEIFNCDTAAKKVSVAISVYGRNFKKTVIQRLSWQPRTIRVPGLSDMDKAGDNQVLELSARTGINFFKVPIPLPGFRWWNPETPWLYQIHVRLVDESGAEIDAVEKQFGMRTFAIDDTTTPKGTPILNGSPIRLRGANTMGFEQLCVMRKDWDQLRDDILLAKFTHMNFLRLTQRPVQDEVYEWCDRLGLMTQTDLPLFGCLRRNQFVEAVRQAGEMERLVRSHPCNIVVSYINEPFPNADGSPHRHLTRSELTEFFRAADIVVRQMNPDRVIKPVDGDYDPPAPGLPDIHCYNGWYLSNGVGLGELHKGFWQLVKPGWNFGCGEFGAEGIEDEVTMRRHYPHWLPAAGADESTWTPSCIKQAQTGAFYHMWFERPDTVAGWVSRSQGHQAWVTKLMTEAFRRNPRMVSFAIHQYIDAFPSGWMKAIVDVDRRPKPAYYAYREALTPLMVSLRSDRSAFFEGERIFVESWVCNDKEETPAKTELEYTLVAGDRVLQQGRATVKAPELSALMAGSIPVVIPSLATGRSVTLRVSLLGNGRVLHENELELSIFARPPVAARGSVRVIGAKNGLASRLARSLKLGQSGMANVILIDDYAAFSKRDRSAVSTAVRRGAHAIFLNLPSGEFAVGGDTIEVQRGAMGPRHFVARALGHVLTREFGIRDFRFWYDRALDRPAPILESLFTAPGWEPILTSGNPVKGKEWDSFLAVASKREGKGRWTVSQLSLSGRIEGNPVAEIFARKLIAPANSF